jgi:phosphoserine phosphatase
MRPGDLFAVISDGFFEYENRAGEAFGCDRLAAWARTVQRSGADQAAIDSLRASVEDFAAGAPQEDDMTVVVIRRTPSGLTCDDSLHG